MSDVVIQDRCYAHRLQTMPQIMSLSDQQMKTMQNISHTNIRRGTALSLPNVSDDKENT